MSKLNETPCTHDVDNLDGYGCSVAGSRPTKSSATNHSDGTKCSKHGDGEYPSIYNSNINIQRHFQRVVIIYLPMKRSFPLFTVNWVIWKFSPLGEKKKNLSRFADRHDHKRLRSIFNDDGYEIKNSRSFYAVVRKGSQVCMNEINCWVFYRLRVYGFEGEVRIYC